MRKALCLILVLLAMAAVACGGDNPLKGDPVELTSLQGTYDVIGYACTINVDESAIWLSNCGETTDSETWTAEGSGTLNDDVLSVAGTGTSVGTCYSWDMDVEASATKLEDREDSGIFSSFAGKWDGSLALSVRETSHAGAECERAEEDTSIDVANVTFTADVKGQLIDAMVTVFEDGESEEPEPLTIAGTSDLITVNDEGGVERR